MASHNLLLMAATMIVCVPSKGKVTQMSTIPIAHVGIPSYYPAATCTTVTSGVAVVAATRVLINSLAAYFLSTSEPFLTSPSNICIRDIAASSICSAPVAPCCATVCPVDTTLAAGSYYTIDA